MRLCGGGAQDGAEGREKTVIDEEIDLAPLTCQGVSLVAQMVKKLPATQETRVQSLGWEDPPEKEMAAHVSILAWRISWTEEPGGLQFIVSQRARHD